MKLAFVGDGREDMFWCRAFPARRRICPSPTAFAQHSALHCRAFLRLLPILALVHPDACGADDSLPFVADAPGVGFEQGLIGYLGDPA